MGCLLGRPTSFSVDIVLPRFYLFLSIFFVYHFRQLPSELAELNSNKTGHMLGNECDLKVHVRNLGYPFPLKIGGPKPPFFDDIATLAAYIYAYRVFAFYIAV